MPGSREWQKKISPRSALLSVAPFLWPPTPPPGRTSKPQGFIVTSVDGHQGRRAHFQRRYPKARPSRWPLAKLSGRIASACSPTGSAIPWMVTVERAARPPLRLDAGQKSLNLHSKNSEE